MNGGEDAGRGARQGENHSYRQGGKPSWDDWENVAEVRTECSFLPLLNASGAEVEFAVWPVEYGEAWECELNTAVPFEPRVVGATDG